MQASSLRVSEGWEGENFPWVRSFSQWRRGQYLCAVLIPLGVDGVGWSPVPEGLAGDAHFHAGQRGAHGACRGEQHGSRAQPPANHTIRGAGEQLLI